MRLGKMMRIYASSSYPAVSNPSLKRATPFFYSTCTHNSPLLPLHTMSDYFEVEARLQEALAYKQENPNVSFRWLARQFRVHKDRIHRRWKGTQKSKSTRERRDVHADCFWPEMLCTNS